MDGRSATCRNQSATYARLLPSLLTSLIVTARRSQTPRVARPRVFGGVSAVRFLPTKQSHPRQGEIAPVESHGRPPRALGGVGQKSAPQRQTKATLQQPWRRMPAEGCVWVLYGIVIARRACGSRECHRRFQSRARKHMHFASTQVTFWNRHTSTSYGAGKSENLAENNSS